MRERLAIFAERGDFGEGVAGAGEKFFGGGGIESDADLFPWSLEEFGIGEVHGRLIVVRRNARPGNVHGCGIEYGDRADSAGGVKRLPALAGGLIMRGESGGDVLWRAGEVDSDFAIQIEAGGLVAGFLELLDGVSLRFFEAFAAGVAAFERIVSEEFDMRPPGVAVEVGGGGILLTESGHGKSKY